MVVAFGFPRILGILLIVLLHNVLLCHASEKLIDRSSVETETSLSDEDFEDAELLTIVEQNPYANSTVHPNCRSVQHIVSASSPLETPPPEDEDARKAVRNFEQLWPAARVPYTISSYYTYTAKTLIARAMRNIEIVSCVRFVSKTASDIDYVHISPLDGCYSLIGRSGGEQPLSLSDGCLDVATIMHELMHVLGFYHEQNRPDRDYYVNINWENIEEGEYDQFSKVPSALFDYLDSGYDFGSLMHYYEDEFSKNGLPTITSKYIGYVIGRGNGLTPSDINRLNLLYRCPATTSSTTTTTTTTTTTLAPITLPPILCRDQVSQCEFYTMIISCDVDFIGMICAKTCNKCTEGPPCEDTDDRCERWARKGHCAVDHRKHDRAYRRCKKSCNLCGTP